MIDYIELNYDSIEAETLKAILFIFGDEHIWIPRSQIEDDPLADGKGEGKGAVFVAPWLVKQNGLEGYKA